MKIGLINIDSKIPNIALMKLSAYHKSKGDHVEWYWRNTFYDKYDKIYASKVFDFSKLPEDMPDNVEIGGSGYNIKKTLPDEIELLGPDYSLYPDCDFSIGFITRGCIRKCDFCKVPDKEGNIRFHQRMKEFENPNGKYWMLLDNNILAYKDVSGILYEIIEKKYKIDFNQGMDIRLVTEEIASLLARVKWLRFLRFSFDSPSMENMVIEKIKLLNSVGIKNYRLMFYILIGFNTTENEDEDRAEMLKQIGVDVFAMPYNKADTYQKKFARWVNHKAIFKTVKWKDYK